MVRRLFNMEKTQMRYCYTEASKAEITIEFTLYDLRELLAVLEAAAELPDATHRTKRLARELREYSIEAAESLRREASSTLRELKGDS